MIDSLTVLVAGATGRQGGAVARRLLERGHVVRALTRRPDAKLAKQLQDMGAEVVGADLADHAKLAKALRDISAVFATATPLEAGTDAETRQGISLIDAAHEVGVEHLVYSSVARADEDSGVSYFASKYVVEQHIKSLAVPYTIVGPAFFMENLLESHFLERLKQGKLVMSLPAPRRLQQIAVADVAAFVVMVLERRDEFLSRRIDIAAAEPSGAEMAAVLTEAARRPIAYLEEALVEVHKRDEETASMYEWLDRAGYGIDIAKLREQYPEVGWHTFGDWAAEQDWSVLD